MIRELNKSQVKQVQKGNFIALINYFSIDLVIISGALFNVIDTPVMPYMIHLLSITIYSLGLNYIIDKKKTVTKTFSTFIYWFQFLVWLGLFIMCNVYFRENRYLSLLWTFSLCMYFLNGANLKTAFYSIITISATYILSSYLLISKFNQPGNFTLEIYHCATFLAVAMNVVYLAEVFHKRRKELAKMKQILETHNTRLKDLDKQKTFFFQNISHELRTPLTLIMSPLQEINKVLKNNEYLKIATNNTNKLYRLVNQLLDFQKLSIDDKSDIILTPINLNTLLETISKSITSTEDIDKYNFSLKLMTKDHIYIKGEVDSIEKIVFNYISNAIKHSGKSGNVTLLLEVLKDKMARISVIDTGIGISDKDQEKLFQIFSQVDRSTSRNFEGTGLGLALVNELAIKLNGKVGVISEEGFGSTFYVDFPIFKTKSALLDVLIVDDEKMHLQSIETLLATEQNRKVMCADSAKQAKEYLKQHRFKCILSDLVMKEEDGISLLKHVDTTYPLTRKILMTGQGNIESLTDATNEAKLNKILLKPFDSVKWIQTINEMLQDYDKGCTDEDKEVSNFEPKDWHMKDIEINSSTKNDDKNAHETNKATLQDSNSELILVVDDVWDMCEMISQSLSKHDYNIIVATNGKEALEEINKYKPDLVITDWMMPKMNGLELVEELKNNEETASIPTILLTAKADNESKLIGEKFGASAYLSKPFDELELISLVENLLRLKRSEAKTEELNRELTENVLKRFLPPTLVDKIVKEGTSFKNEYSNKQLTVMFTDICSFSSISADIGPKNMSRMLNLYLDEMTSIIFEHNGTIDKIIGDSIMAFWGAPEDIHAVEQVKSSYECSIAIRNKMHELNTKWKADGLPTFQKRIGIHHGSAIVGYFGGKHRSDYTAIGPTINLAQRIENAAGPDEIFISSVIRDILPETSQWESAGSFDLKGCETNQTLYKIID